MDKGQRGSILLVLLVVVGVVVLGIGVFYFKGVSLTGNGRSSTVSEVDYSGTGGDKIVTPEPISNDTSLSTLESEIESTLVGDTAQDIDSLESEASSL